MAKVVVAMSGGVDSSVAAALLVNQGYEVTGMMLRLWSEPGAESSNRCCTPDAMAQARRVAARLGIPFYAVDARDYFYQQVVNNFVEGYQQGITPNPCLTCNQQVRWGLLMQRARAMGADFMATGHYARVEFANDSHPRLLKGKDEQKDQSYVLSVLNQDQLAHTLLPLGSLTKPEVRELAHGFGLSVANRPDSQDLCFLGSKDYRRFLATYTPSTFLPGDIRNLQGELLGKHQGLANFTIGQRKGLGIPSREALYVIDKQLATNTLIVGLAEELGKVEFYAKVRNWIAGEPPGKTFSAEVKIRYKAPAVSCLITMDGNDGFTIQVQNPLRDITPGQAAVLYNGEECLGSGIIQP